MSTTKGYIKNRFLAKSERTSYADILITPNLFVDMNNKAIVILGTTASGKTRLAVELAKKFNGEIISADSRQVYCGMDLGTGKDLNEYNIKNQESRIKNLRPRRISLGLKNYNTKLRVIPYHLIDIISPKKQFTVAEYQKKAYVAIENILKRGKLPIICGGTGLYIDAVTKGFKFSKLRITNDELRKIRNKLENTSLLQLLAQLKKIDFITFEIIDKKNRRRVQRALEIYYVTGIPKSKQLAATPPPYEFLKIGVTFPKIILTQRIKNRLNDRFEAGMIREVKKLRRQGVSWKRLDQFGLEYRWISRFLRGRITKPEMLANLYKDINNFSKRQMTWFKRDPGIYWINNKNQLLKTVNKFIDK